MNPSGNPGPWGQPQWGTPGPPGYPHPQAPPPPKKSNTGLIIALVAVGLVVVGGSCAGAIGLAAVRQYKHRGEEAMKAIEESRKAAEATRQLESENEDGVSPKTDLKNPAPLLEPLSTQFSTKNHLVTIHYPDSFAAKATSDATVILSRNLGSDVDEVLAFIAIAHPISDDLAEFTRVVYKGETSKYGRYRETTRRDSVCGGVAGKEIRGVWYPSANVEYTRVACYFIKHGRGYAMSYTAPSSQWAAREPTLRAIAAQAHFE